MNAVLSTTKHGLRIVLCLLLASGVLVADEFSSDIRPVLVENCQACHGPESKNRIRFLTDKTVADVSKNRGLWRSVAMQLRNRTMPPPPGRQPSEHDRFRVASWIDETLRLTACDLGEFAGSVTVRRLNRHEYQNTLRDLFGLHFELAELFPVDGSGGEGFDNNGETLFLSPLLVERYLEVAQQILDDVVITPPLERSFVAKDLLPDRQIDEHDSIGMDPTEIVTRTISVYEDGDYDVRVWIRSPEVEEKPTADILVDGNAAGQLMFSWSVAKATNRSTTIPLGRGMHEISFAVSKDSPSLRLITIDVEQKPESPDPSKLAAHFRVFGREPGQTPLSPHRAAEKLLQRFLPRAFRRPVEPSDWGPFLGLFDRASERGDPYEESVKVALKAVLVSPDFLFRMETAPRKPGAQPISDHELATRLSYFLWGTMPDLELLHLADDGRLQDEQVLSDQVERLLDHPRSRFFVRTFMGQWLGTKDVGGRVAPTLNEIQHFYTPQIAADMREEPILLFQRMLSEDRSLLDFVNADYTYLTERLAQHYGMPHAVVGNRFQLVSTPDGRRGGLLGLGAVQAMNAGYKRSSPVLRGVWVLETLLGTKVPTPPADIPPLETEENKERNLTVREMLNEHRANPSCAACHDVIDPIGFGLENYDWLGRWRDADSSGRSVDASGVLPSGEAFDGPAELRQVLLRQKDELLRHVTRKMLGYALGRSLLDEDLCVVEGTVKKLEKSNYGARSLVREVVLSRPFRYAERDTEASNRN